jgi:histone H3/H4
MSTEPLLPKTRFAKLCREVCLNSSSLGASCRWTGVALNALQEATEAFLVANFESKYYYPYCYGVFTYC